MYFFCKKYCIITKFALSLHQNYKISIIKSLYKFCEAT